MRRGLAEIQIRTLPSVVAQLCARIAGTAGVEAVARQYADHIPRNAFYLTTR